MWLCLDTFLYPWQSVWRSLPTAETEWAITRDSSLRWRETSFSLQLHINGVIRELSVHGERVNKMGQATLEAGCWLTSISFISRGFISLFLRRDSRQANQSTASIGLARAYFRTGSATFLVPQLEVYVGKWKWPHFDTCSIPVAFVWTTVIKKRRRDIMSWIW